MLNFKNYILLFLAITILISCSKDDDTTDSNTTNISSQTLQGTIFGESFTGVGGKAFESSFGEEERVSINITNVSADCESTIFDYDLYISCSVLFEEGTYTDSNVVFHKEDELLPLNVFQSTVIIEEITETTITVQIASESIDGESKVEGTFTVDYCE